MKTTTGAHLKINSETVQAKIVALIDPENIKSSKEGLRLFRSKSMKQFLLQIIIFFLSKLLVKNLN